ncbi:dihydrodipicolinate synthase family protein [bacterium]|nr:dihydrodipicolinate synthase family protein [Rubripirellula sp.]MDA7865091.1 dihydrodipicolinate synthase family protein [bacterium]MDB4624833.1 dihydrodipicolinate synthase family protein [Rubripirellula sp.]
MNTAPFAAAQLRESVIAVPPLARDSSLDICEQENRKIIGFLEAGGVRSLLYGGNAVLYHARLSEYASLLQMLAETASDQTVVVPSLGPAFGLAMDQAAILREYDFPTAMLLPSRDAVDQVGIATGVRQLAEAVGKPLVLYLKFDRWLNPELIKSLEEDGVISWLKYAVVKDDPSQDDYLREVLDVFPAERIVSGIGEQPAIIHLRDFGVGGFTSGCVCVAPEKSIQMMNAIHSGNFDLAETLREWFCPLENLRNEINPIKVLHRAVELAGIANTGPMQPLLSDVTLEDAARIRFALQQMQSTV